MSPSQVQFYWKIELIKTQPLFSVFLLISYTIEQQVLISFDHQAQDGDGEPSWLTSQEAPVNNRPILGIVSGDYRLECLG